MHRSIIIKNMNIWSYQRRPTPLSYLPYLDSLIGEHPLYRQHLIGGAMRDRTADLLRAKQALSQLSYSPSAWSFFAWVRCISCSVGHYPFGNSLLLSKCALPIKKISALSAQTTTKLTSLTLPHAPCNDHHSLSDRSTDKFCSRLGKLLRSLLIINE